MTQHLYYVILEGCSNPIQRQRPADKNSQKLINIVAETGKEGTFHFLPVLKLYYIPELIGQLQH